MRCEDGSPLVNSDIAATLVGAAAAAPRRRPSAPEPLLAPTEEQMKIRNIQTRTFDVADRTDRHARRDRGAPGSRASSSSAPTSRSDS